MLIRISRVISYLIKDKTEWMRAFTTLQLINTVVTITIKLMICFLQIGKWTRNKTINWFNSKESWTYTSNMRRRCKIKNKNKSNKWTHRTLTICHSHKEKQKIAVLRLIYITTKRNKLIHSSNTKKKNQKKRLQLSFNQLKFKLTRLIKRES